MMQMHHFLRNLRVPIGKVGHLYLTRIREGIFSATQFSDKRASRKSGFVLCSQTPHSTHNATQDRNRAGFR